MDYSSHKQENDSGYCDSVQPLITNETNSARSLTDQHLEIPEMDNSAHVCDGFMTDHMDNEAEEPITKGMDTDSEQTVDADKDNPLYTDTLESVESKPKVDSHDPETIKKVLQLIKEMRQENREALEKNSNASKVCGVATVNRFSALQDSEIT